MTERKGYSERTTTETHISVEACLDGNGVSHISTGIGFFDHMLTLFSVHSCFNLNINADGDLNVDGHHTVEDVGIVLGKAIHEALGDKKGITRYGTVFLPMDESLAMVCIDISGRPYLHLDLPEMPSSVGNFDTQLVEEFFKAFVIHSRITLHIRVLYGRNAHHIIESIFKAWGRAMKTAVAFDNGTKTVPSSKGLID
jgi:imidazoleglycerol-phosphate dehydratase